MTNELPRGWKKLAQQTCQQIIARTPDGIPVSPGDAQFAAALLDRHPDATVKKGAGVAGFTVATDTGRGHSKTRHFVIMRTDGTSTDFSWRECITPAGHVTKVRNAMRAVIEPQVTGFRNASDPLGCALGASHPGPFHVDHADPQFITLADQFAAAKGGYGQVGLLPHRDGDTADRLEPGDAEVFARFHQARAVLRILCAKCNQERR